LAQRAYGKRKVDETCKLKKWNGPRRHEKVLESDEKVCEMKWRLVHLAGRIWELHLEAGVLGEVCGE
jgi:hypothetical protein